MEKNHDTEQVSHQRSILFLKHKHPQSKSGTSIANPGEAEMAMSVAVKVKGAGVKPENIVFLTGYIGQLGELKKHLNEDEDTCCTVRCFQGSEKQVRRCCTVLFSKSTSSR